jgi:phenylacetic acid degradation operon negative regulatory protein
VRAQPRDRGSPLVSLSVTEEAAPAIALFERRPQSLVITLLGAYVHPDDRPVWSGGLVTLLREFGFSEGAARVALARLTRRGLLARVRDGRLVHYRLTARASTLLDEGDRRIFSLGRDLRSAEVWTVLWHAIPEDRRLERARLARRLRFLGFGPLHDGAWISPHDREQEVTALLTELRVVRHAAVLLGRPAGSLGFEPLAARAWDLDELEKRYRSFVLAFEKYAHAGAEGLDDRVAFLVRTHLVHAFRQFPFLDPGLPDDRMPTNGHRARAVALFDALYESLAEPAQRHFDSITVPRSPSRSPRRQASAAPRSP